MQTHYDTLLPLLPTATCALRAERKDMSQLQPRAKTLHSHLMLVHAMMAAQGLIHSHMQLLADCFQAETKSRVMALGAQT